MINQITKRILQATGQNWGKPDDAEKKVGEKKLKNELTEFEIGNQRKKHKRTKKEYKIGDTFCIDAFDAMDKKDSKKSYCTINKETGEPVRWHLLGLDYQERQKNRHLELNYFRFIFEVEVTCIISNARSRKDTYYAKIVGLDGRKFIGTNEQKTLLIEEGKRLLIGQEVLVRR